MIIPALNERTTRNCEIYILASSSLSPIDHFLAILATLCDPTTTTMADENEDQDDLQILPLPPQESWAVIPFRKTTFALADEIEGQDSIQVLPLHGTEPTSMLPLPTNNRGIFPWGELVYELRENILEFLDPHDRDWRSRLYSRFEGSYFRYNGDIPPLVVALRGQKSYDQVLRWFHKRNETILLRSGEETGRFRIDNFTTKELECVETIDYILK